MQGPALDWLFVSASWIDITAGSGSSRRRGEVPPSGSRSPSDASARAFPLRILIVEDNAADLFLIREAIETARIDADIHVAKDGEEATNFFDQADANAGAPCPGLVILDINLPKKQGTDVLQHLRKSPRCGNALVIVVSTSQSARDRQDVMKFGANVYFPKPSEYDEFLKLGDRIKDLVAIESPPEDGEDD
jgi:two-component system, chemotaxis family, response regulator Rcp1